MNARAKLQTWSDRLARMGLIVVVLTVSISLVLGLLAAWFGSFLTPLGSGLGGGWGIPMLALNLAMLLGLPSLLLAGADLARGRRDQAGRMLAFWGPFFVGFGFIQIAHAIDPCFRGTWTLGSYLGSIPLCELFWPEINIHTRFHLLLHSAPAVVLVGLYWAALNRWHPSF